MGRRTDRPARRRVVDVDGLVLGLLDHGEEPDVEQGWLPSVESALRRALADHDVVSVEATGAWDTDYRLADHLEREGHKVLRVWVTASEDEWVARLRARTAGKVAVDEVEARRSTRLLRPEQVANAGT